MRIQAEDFDVAALQETLLHVQQQSGAVATFTGYVRREGSRPALTGLYVEHYPQMTELSIRDILQDAGERWSLHNAQVVHRVGELALGEKIVWVGVSASHRSAAFSACEFIMDYLKSSAPLWKRELGPADARWLDSRGSDSERAERWQQGASNHTSGESGQ